LEGHIASKKPSGRTFTASVTFMALTGRLEELFPAMAMLASAAQGTKNRLAQPSRTGCGPRSANGSVCPPFMRASISALFMTSGTETVCAAELLCSCGFWGSRGCCGNEILRRGQKALGTRKTFGAQPALLDSRVS